MENKFSYEAKMKYCIYYLLILKSLFFIKKFQSFWDGLQQQFSLMGHDPFGV